LTEESAKNTGVFINSGAELMKTLLMQK